MDIDPRLTTAILIAIWIGAVWYSKRTFPFLACAACNGTGRVIEPRILAYLCFRFKQRAWRACRTCAGTAKKERRRWWH